jgi:hypothetical protein
MEECPKCKRKALYYRSSFRSHRCNRCYAIFDDEKRFRGYDDTNEMHFDEYCNMFYTEITSTSYNIIQKNIFILEEGKTTLRGSHEKISSECPSPERLSCNYGVGFDRCSKMKYTGQRWVCE